jgi:hypothetical protein
MFVILPNPHPRAPTCHSTPKVLSAKERAPTFYSFVTFALNSHLSLSRSSGPRHTITLDSFGFGSSTPFVLLLTIWKLTWYQNLYLVNKSYKISQQPFKKFHNEYLCQVDVDTTKSLTLTITPTTHTKGVVTIKYSLLWSLHKSNNK